ncbi:diguanylate cyclase (GGDEF) domain-containing protein [Thermanaeromonas toyohensis ToBE]|uniref:Diguanylate cyclase (GGDEF) domain-containing protein n=1 Tax=Thermanaeromonas toyohensis ToBE TaxID=698762 RepID=A0A1W1VIF7_9FIRM|nr:GGDEF domain-containing protein [Thermanaeromonas toyohensis]SMB93159.1 diguanylate cyclase (GGDEF) domain-containing protein [Thermanaeromonas toyohensis ToBE]
MPGDKRTRSIIEIFTLWFFGLALVPTLLVIYATAKYLAIQTVAWANRYLTQVAFDESRVISLYLKDTLGDGRFFFSIQGNAIIAAQNGLVREIDLSRLVPVWTVEPEPAQIFAPKLLFGFGYQPRLKIREKPFICLEDSYGNTLYLAGREEKISARETFLLKAFGLKESIEVSAPVPETDLKVKVRASAGGIVREPLQQLCVPLGGTLILVALLSVVLYSLAARQVVYPLKDLAERLSGFDPANGVDLCSRDSYGVRELAEIASSFGKMVLRVREALSELEQKVKELEEKNKLLHQARQRLEWLASHDALTGVLNRRSFMERCLYLLRQVRGEFPYVGILMMDVDNFKTINDTYGHLAGDMVLKKVGELLRHQVRKGDLVGRYGGDEFVLSFFLSRPEEFEALARRIFSSLCATLGSLPELEVGVSLSMGGTVTSCFLIRDGRDLEQLIGLSDRLLLEGKRGGKKRVVIQYIENIP